jgi:hypothetical protein
MAAFLASSEPSADLAMAFNSTPSRGDGGPGLRFGVRARVTMSLFVFREPVIVSRNSRCSPGRPG